MNSGESAFFGKDHAANYDKNSERLSVIKEALHLVIKTVLLHLPYESNILCVGAGTGAELIALAQDNPGWRFTALDSSEAMLDICREKVEKLGLLARCDFHAGCIDSLPANTLYNAATSILVSQFLTEKPERVAFFEHIKKHLHIGGLLVNADLARPQDDLRYKVLMEFWFNMQKYNGLSDERARASTSLWGKFVSVSKPQEIEDILVSSGFKNPTPLFQTLFIHAWAARLTE